MSEKPTIQVHCALCKNHTILSKLKGHKGKCRYDNCQCSHCCLVRDRRIIMSKQQSLRRKLDFETKEKPKTEKQKSWLETMQADSSNFPGIFLCGLCHSEWGTSELLIQHIQKTHKQIYRQYDDVSPSSSSYPEDSNSGGGGDPGMPLQPAEANLADMDGRYVVSDHAPPKKRWKDLHFDRTASAAAAAAASARSHRSAARVPAGAEGEPQKDFKVFNQSFNSGYLTFGDDNISTYPCNQGLFYTSMHTIIRPWEYQ